MTGLRFLKEIGTVHGDVAARSVLLAEGDVCKLRLKLDTLLELRNKLPESQADRSHLKWAAPEAIDTGNATERSDIWSFGVFLWELGTYGAVHPYDGWDLARTQQELKTGYRLPKLLGMQDDFYTVIRLCWSRVPSERSTPDQLAPLLDKVADDFQAAHIQKAAKADAAGVNRRISWHRAGEIVDVSDGPPPIPSRNDMASFGNAGDDTDANGAASRTSADLARMSIAEESLNDGDAGVGGGVGDVGGVGGGGSGGDDDDEEEESPYMVMELTGENPFDNADIDESPDDLESSIAASAASNGGNGSEDQGLVVVGSESETNASSNPFASDLRKASDVGGGGGGGGDAVSSRNTNPFEDSMVENTNPFAAFMSEADAKGLDAEDMFEAMAEINIGPSEGKGDPDKLLDEVPIYHGHIDRAEAEARLTACGVMGTYLVRARDEACTSFAFSQLGKGMTVIHSKIDYLADAVLIDGKAGALLQGAPLQEVVAAALWKREHFIIGMGSSSATPLVRPGAVLLKVHRAPKPSRPKSRPFSFGGDGKLPPPAVKPRRKSQETLEDEFVQEREREATEEEELPEEDRDLTTIDKFVGDWTAVHKINRKAFASASVA